MLSSLDIPSSCFTQTWVTTPPGDLQPGLLIGNPYDTRCFPVGLGVTVSPAKCPQGYVSACAPTSILIPQETVYDCCPTNYSCDGGFFKCTSAIGKTVTLTVTDLDASQKPILKTTVTDGMNAHSVRVRFANSDLVGTTTTTTTPSSSSSSVATSSISATPSSTTSLPTSTSAPPSSPSEGLSTGAKAGIGVGVGVGALAILGIAFFLFKRRGQKSVNRAELDYSPAFQPPPPLTPSPQKHPSELDSSMPPVLHEMESPDQRYESHR